ncbi:MAG: hypothetical protein HQL70_04360 [Magnetococcales bacterium]|nr:hypothetical protein [Magnetococcales bacterium]
MELATAIISQHNLPKGWLEEILLLLPENIKLEIFYVGSGTMLVDTPPRSPHIKKILYCSHSHRVLNGPKPGEDMVAGGLLDLGGMVVRSQYLLSLPQSNLPLKPTKSKLKEIGLILDPDPERMVEGLRVATGLAGCNHQMVLFYHKKSLDKPCKEAKTYIEALTMLGAEFQTTQPPYEWFTGDFLIRI